MRNEDAEDLATVRRNAVEDYMRAKARYKRTLSRVDELREALDRIKKIEVEDEHLVRVALARMDLIARRYARAKEEGL